MLHLNYMEIQILDWLVLACNNILNVYDEWPMTQVNFENYLLDKYGTYD